MKAVAFCGSPRKGGNTEVMLGRCAKGLEAAGIETDLVLLAGKTIEPCTACAKCKEKKDLKCSIRRDDFHGCFEKMLAADIILVGSPVYFGSATPQTMALLDRAGYVARANGNPLSRKLGGPVAVARRAGQNFTLAQLLYWYLINDMVVVGSTYWNMAIGRDLADVEADDEGLATLDRFVENLVWAAEKLAGRPA